MDNKVTLRRNCTNVDLQARPFSVTISSVGVSIYTASFNTKNLPLLM